MKCPRCGSEMAMDSHRKYSVPMCYECGYMEGRDMGDNTAKMTNFERMKALNFNELAVFLSSELGLDEEKLTGWLCESYKL